MEKIFIYDTTEIEVLKVNGDKRLVKRIFKKKSGKIDNVDYCIQTKINGFNDDRWRIDYFNRSRTKTERRFLGL